MVVTHIQRAASIPHGSVSVRCTYRGGSDRATTTGMKMIAVVARQRQGRGRRRSIAMGSSDESAGETGEDGGRASREAGCGGNVIRLDYCTYPGGRYKAVTSLFYK